ncbi:Eco57I restriction-modification methylase domain-containing protein [Halorubrum sp. FL23]|uniref:Eco57I restriction-modification methylase domain-containing protein n=1 Tax=Halorubrum sp. FL23 TaxID=3458704 RepID=UPI0040341579
MTTVASIKSVLDDFLEELNDEFDDPHDIERILNGDREITQRDIGAEPETWTEDILINPIIDAVGLHKAPGRPTSQRKTPDFKLEEEQDGQSLEVVGENKSLNKIKDAENDLVSDYLSNISFANDGIATDGLDWVVYRTERGGDFFEHEVVRRHSFRDALRQLARDENIITQQGLPDSDTDVESELEAFALTFQPEHLVPLLTKTAPTNFRDRRQKDVDDFYEVYIEVLFGESDDHNFETCLRNDIEVPEGASRKDKDVFAAMLVNRLLFIRFLEERGALPDGFLHDRVDDYNEDIPVSLYESTIKPIFYELFNEPRDTRDLTGGWYDDVPYLNGGLFRQNLDNEGQYDVGNPSMILVIDKVIEGNHDLNFEIDPAILGSVFEMTINHISESEDRQKETGAYYTPNDVTHLINSQAIDGRAKDVIVESFADTLDDEVVSTFRRNAEELTLQQILARIEDGEGWYGNTEGLQKAEEAVFDITVLDPACGSGHFLTAAIEQLHQVVQSIYRGRHGGADAPQKKKFEQKCDIALHSIYGVDVDPVATEIAKLRTWLKILEGNEWEEEYGKLPNIDVNILEGNSLFGLPTVNSSGVRPLSVYSDEIDEILESREDYKEESEGDKEDIEDQREDLREELNKEYIDRLTYTVNDEIRTGEELQDVVSAIDFHEFQQYVETVSVKREDHDEFTSEEMDVLTDSGFSVHHQHKSAKLSIGDRIDELQNPKLDNEINNKTSAAEAIVETLEELLDGSEYYFNKVSRRPVTSDLDNIEGHTFHWIAEFPEARLGQDDREYEMGFDVIVGNPPYGPILNDSEKILVEEYETSGVGSEVSAQFVERQLQLLRDRGYFGNIHAMGILYTGNFSDARSVIRKYLVDARVSCFGHRPSTIFAGANPRCAITTGKKSHSTEPHGLKSSAFILFYSEDRKAAFEDIEYESIEGLVLGDRIGDEENNDAYPKVGSEKSREVLSTLRDETTRVFDDVISRNSGTTDHVVYRQRHPLYWMNPFMEDIYPAYGESSPQDFEPMYYDNELERKAGFVLLQSSMFYHYWMTYGNQRDLNWGPIEAFPFPTHDALEAHEEEIDAIAEDMWEEMEAQFDGRNISQGELLKPMADRADDVLGPLLGLSDEQVEWLKDYDTEFGRAP